MPNSRDFAAKAAIVALSRKATADFVFVPEQSYQIETNALGDVHDEESQCCDHRRSTSSSFHQAMHGYNAHQVLEDIDEQVGTLQQNLLRPPNGSVSSVTDVADSHGHGVHHHHIEVGPGALSWVIAFMLSVHSLITGAALGMASGLVIYCFVHILKGLAILNGSWRWFIFLGYKELWCLRL